MEFIPAMSSLIFKTLSGLEYVPSRFQHSPCNELLALVALHAIFEVVVPQTERLSVVGHVFALKDSGALRALEAPYMPETSRYGPITIEHIGDGIRLAMIGSEPVELGHCGGNRRTPHILERYISF